MDACAWCFALVMPWRAQALLSTGLLAEMAALGGNFCDAKPIVDGLRPPNSGHTGHRVII